VLTDAVSAGAGLEESDELEYAAPLAAGARLAVVFCAIIMAVPAPSTAASVNDRRRRRERQIGVSICFELLIRRVCFRFGRVEHGDWPCPKNVG
jgi:hypothetical protein